LYWRDGTPGIRHRAPPREPGDDPAGRNDQTGRADQERLVDRPRHAGCRPIARHAKSWPMDRRHDPAAERPDLANSEPQRQIGSVHRVRRTVDCRRRPPTSPPRAAYRTLSRVTDLQSQLQATLSGAYTLERELGGGGMSRVFVADEVRLRRKVVVKVLAPELAAGISAERFEREIRTAASLQQANIVPVLATGDTDGLPYYTMPFVEGESLRARLSKQPPLAISDTLRILGDVGRALQYAHDHGIVHRDIKPDNVLLSGGTAVVTDFGIAKALSDSRT